MSELTYKTWIKNIDWQLLGMVCCVLGIGLATVYSASRQAGSDAVGIYFYRQIIWIAVSMVTLLVVLIIDYHFTISLAPFIFAAVVCMLLWVLVAGHAAQGARRWVGFGPIRIQPSEFAKLALVLILVKYFDSLREKVERFWWFAGALFIAGSLGLFIVAQPDLGTSLVFVPMVLVMLYLGGCRKRHIALVCVAGMAASPFMWMALKDYQRRRIMAFIDPSADPLGSGWQSLQSQIAIGSGGLFGKGWMHGTQSGLKFLPAQHTDFIFSVFAEEWGLAGSIVLITLYALIIWRATRIAAEARDFSGQLLAGGLTTLLAIHIIINIAITVKMMPVTGLPLPFMSYGGSFMLAMTLCVGLILNVGMRRTIF